MTHIKEIRPNGVLAFIPWDVILHLGLAVRQGCDEETQRAQHGVATVDFINELSNVPEFGAWYRSLFSAELLPPYQSWSCYMCGATVKHDDAFHAMPNGDLNSADGDPYCEACFNKLG